MQRWPGAHAELLKSTGWGLAVAALSKFAPFLDDFCKQTQDSVSQEYAGYWSRQQDPRACLCHHCLAQSSLAMLIYWAICRTSFKPAHGCCIVNLPDTPVAWLGAQETCKRRIKRMHPGGQNHPQWSLQNLTMSCQQRSQTLH